MLQKNSKNHISSSAISPTPSSSFQRPSKDRIIQSLIPIHQPVVRFDIFDNENSSSSFIQLYYCEECSKETAEKKCDACQTFYCLNCCRLAHISVSFKTSIHPHEKSIRSLTRLDKGKLPIPRDKSNGYILPDSVTYEEDVLQHKDISLACSLSSPILPKIPNSKQKLHQKMKYKQGDIVLFLNPNNGMDSYGRVLSNLDAIRYSANNSTALYRGENTVVFYEVQVINSIQHMEQIVRQLINEESNKEIEERNRNQRDVTEITDLKCRQYLYLAVDVNRKAGNLVRHKLASTTFEDAYQKNLASFHNLRCTFDKTSIVMLSESELQSPQEKLEILSSARNAIFMKLFLSFDQRMFKRIYLHSFERWRFVVNTIKKESQGRAALIIQRSWKYFSLWRSHKIAKERRDCYLREKWLALHEKFRVREHKDDDGITYDDKLYFNTHADCSRYFFAVKKAVLKIRSQCEAVVNEMYKLVFDRWKKILVQSLKDQLHSSTNFIYSIESKEEGSKSLALPPLKSPSSGIHLPPLKSLFTPKNAEERLFLGKDKRLEYCDFQRFAEGPTDQSCRVIPGNNTIKHFYPTSFCLIILLRPSVVRTVPFRLGASRQN